MFSFVSKIAEIILANIKFIQYIKSMKNKMLAALHENGQKAIRRAHAAERDNKRVCAFVNFHLFNMCYNVRDLLRK